jgi:hypothetical protein
MTQPATKTYTLRQVATITGWNLRTIGNAAKSKKLKCLRAGDSGMFRCTAEQIIDFFGNGDPDAMQKLIEQYDDQQKEKCIDKSAIAGLFKK